MQFNWDDARLFLEVARQGQIKAAAQALGVTPVTLSRRIADLEARMKTLLFIRHRLGVSLTDDGRIVFDGFERAEGEMIALGNHFDAVAGARITGSVRLAAPDGLLGGVIAPMIGELMAMHPDLRVELVPLPQNVSLTRREADIAITVGAPQGERLAAHPLAQYRLGLYASTEYLRDRGTPQYAEELRDHRLIGFVRELLHSEALDYVREAWPEWRSSVAIHSTIGQVRAVEAGVGIGVLHNFLVNSARLIRVLPEITITREYWLATHENLRQLPRIRAVANFLGRLPIR